MDAVKDLLTDDDEAQTLSKLISREACNAYQLLSGVSASETRVQAVQSQVSELEAQIYELMCTNELGVRRLYFEDLKSGNREYVLAANLSVTYGEHDMVVLGATNTIEILGVSNWELKLRCGKMEWLISREEFPSVGILVENKEAK